jgi:hypothetical protein
MAPAETPDQAAEELLRLATERFRNLSDAEAKLLRAAPKGEVPVCGPSANFDDPSNDPLEADDWGPERQVSAGLIRWLCATPAAASHVDPTGIHLLGAKVPGRLDLSFAAVPFPLRLFRCRLAEEVLLRSTQLPGLYFNGSRTGAVQGDGLSITGNLFLNDSFIAEGEVRLPGVQIGGNLDCSRGTFKNPPQKDVLGRGKALIADGANVQGSVFLNAGFAAEGEVRLSGAEIANNLECSGGTFKNPPRKDLGGGGKALIGDGANVKGSVFLNGGFAAEGEVRLLGTKVGSNLYCSGGVFKNPPRKDVPESGGALIADGVSVKGSVFLREGFMAEGEVRLPSAQIRGELDCTGGKFKNPRRDELPQSGTALYTDGVRVEGDVFLRGDFGAEGEVRLVGAQIGGDLDCDRGTFKNPLRKDVGGGGVALNADGADVRSHVFLRESFTADGEVRLLRAQIGRDLDCSGGTFRNPPQKEVDGSGKALNADGVSVRGGVFLCRQAGRRGKGFTAEGEVRLLRAQVGGNLDCRGGSFDSPPQEDSPETGDALSADGVSVRGDVFLNAGFTARGELRLLGAQIGGSLDCSGGTFKNPPREGLPGSGRALSADGVKVSGSIFLCRQGGERGEEFRAEGEVRLLGARIRGELSCEGAKLAVLNAQGARISQHLLLRNVKDAKSAMFDLTNASTAALVDDEESWPAEGNIDLDGFVYGRISVGPTDAGVRLKWLALQPEFKPQPYRQLAKVLRELGDDRGRRRVLYEMERRRRTQEDKTRYSRLWGQALRATIGYGFRLQRTLYWLAGLTLFGTLLFGLGYLGGSIAPTEREAYACFEKQGWPPRHYQQFNPFVYSLENSVPLLKLGQDTAWAPDPGPREQEHPGAANFAPFKWLARAAASLHLTWCVAPWLLRVCRWGQIILGWMLATLFVAGVTGVVRRE